MPAQSTLAPPASSFSSAHAVLYSEDLLPLVLSHLELKKDLGLCSLVCREWTAPAQRIIFRVISSDNRKSRGFNLVEDIQVLAGSPALRSYVRQVNAHLKPIETVVLGSLLPSLKGLRVCSSDFLTRAPSPALVELFARLELFAFTLCNNWWQVTEVNAVAFAKLINAAKALTSLNLTIVHFDSHGWTASTAGPRQLETVVIKCCVIRDNELAWLVKSSKHSLKQLTIIEHMPEIARMTPSLDGNEPLCKSFLTENGLINSLASTPNLRSLQLHVHTLKSAGLLNILAKLPYLESLVIPMSLIGSSGLKTASDSLKELYLIPPPPGEDDTLARNALKHLKKCPLAKVNKLMLGMGRDVSKSVISSLEEVAQERKLSFSALDN